MQINPGKFFAVFNKKNEETETNYDAIAHAAEKLGYRDKLRLAQALIQRARNEEAQEHPQQRPATHAEKVPVVVKEAVKEEVNGNVRPAPPKIGKSHTGHHGKAGSKALVKAKGKVTSAQQSKVVKCDDPDIDLVGYAASRVLKLRPGKKTGLENSIKAMFQMQGGITDEDIDDVIVGMEKKGYISIDDNRITYLVD